jgi:hypothetical protein
LTVILDVALVIDPEPDVIRLFLGIGLRLQVVQKVTAEPRHLRMTYTSTWIGLRLLRILCGDPAGMICGRPRYVIENGVEAGGMGRGVTFTTWSSAATTRGVPRKIPGFQLFLSEGFGVPKYAARN